MFTAPLVAFGKKALIASAPAGKAILLAVLADALGEEITRKLEDTKTADEIYDIVKREAPKVADEIKPILEGSKKEITSEDVAKINGAATSSGIDTYGNRRARHRAIVTEMRSVLSNAGLSTRQFLAIVKCLNLVMGLQSLASSDYTIEQLIADA